MEVVKQLRLELSQVRKKKSFFEEELKKLAQCIEVLRKEVAYRTILN